MSWSTDGQDNWNTDLSSSRSNAAGNGFGRRGMETPGVFELVITDTWLKQLWLDCLMYDLHIQSNIWQLQPNLSNDMELMWAFVQYGSWGQELQDLNWCCMFLWVIWLPNICDGTSKEILTDAWEGWNPMESPFQWPRTVVTRTDWCLWQQALPECFGLDQWWHLSQQLGRWFPAPTRWFYEPTVDWVWHRAGMEWIYFPYIPSCLRMQYYEAEGWSSETKPLPHHLLWAVVIWHGQWLVLAGHAAIQDEHAPYEGLDKPIHSPLKQDWKVHIQIVRSLNELQQDIRDNHGFAISNGSFQKEAGMAAWIIEGQTAWSWIIGWMITPGQSGDHSSYRSKLVGIYGILITLKALTLNSNTLHCCIACNGKLVLNWINSNHPVLPMEPHADLLYAVKNMVSWIGAWIDWHHVKECQDGKVPMALPWDAWLNIKADILKKR